MTFPPETASNRHISNPASWLNQLLREAAGRGSRLSLFTPEEFEQCRECIADIDMSDADKDELIRVVGNIVASFVDQSFGLHPVQLSLAARANRHFQNGRDDAILGLFQNDESIDPGDGGASNAPNSP